MQLPSGRPNASDAPWPHSLRSHPIFEHSEESQHPQQTQTGPQRRSRVLFRDSDLLVAVNNHIRITSLLDAKTPRAHRTYKTLHTPQVQFPIEQMVLNADGRLLVVAGSHHVTVVVLPTSGRGGRSPIIECKSIQIGAYYYGAKGSPRIAKMEWHPLGDGNTSLFILTADGALREFDPTVDSEEPLQSLSFIQKKKKSNTFNMDDDESTEAVAFAFGCGSRNANGARGNSDWTPLTVFGLMRNGDIFALSPVCPSRLHVHTSYIRSLEAYVRGKEALALKDSSLMTSPTPEFHPAHSFSSSTSSVDVSNELDLPTLYDHQRKYVSALSKQLPNTEDVSTHGLSKDVSIASDSAVSVTSSGVTRRSQMVTLSAPNTIKRDLELQGPFRFQPAPAGALTDWQDMASDILYLSPFSDQSKTENKKVPAIGIVLIAFTDGRVDVCLDLIKVEAVWTRQGATTNSPFFVMLETIDLDITSYFRTQQPPTPSAQGPSGARGLHTLLTSAILPPRYLYHNHPLFLLDPVYEDAVFVYHSFGVHAVWFGWVEELRAALKKSLAKDDDGEEPLQELVNAFLDRENHKEGLSSATHLLSTVDAALKAAHPVNGLAISSDVFVDYSLLATTSNNQVIPLELPLRLPEPDPAEVGPAPGAEAQFKNLAQQKKADLGRSSDALVAPRITQSGEGYRPFTEMKAFAGLPPYRPPSFPAVPPIIVAKDEVSPAQLRQFGNALTKLAEYTQMIQTTMPILEDRLNLLTAERARQIDVIKQSSDFIEKLLGSGKDKPGKQDQTLYRTHRVHGLQPLLLKKVDGILQRLMDSSNGELTDAEKAWFAELKRMGKEVVHSGDGGSLKHRAEQLSNQLERLMPELKEAIAHEQALKEEQQRNLTLGTKQTLSIGQTLGSQDAQIKEAAQRIRDLAARMGVATSATSAESQTDES